MEPFDLTFRHVTTAEDSEFDSFNNVINYDTNFDSQSSLPVEDKNAEKVTYNWRGKALA